MRLDGLPTAALGAVIEEAVRDYWFNHKVSWDRYRTCGEYVAVRLRTDLSVPVGEEHIREYRAPAGVLARARAEEERQAKIDEEKATACADAHENDELSDDPPPPVRVAVEHLVEAVEANVYRFGSALMPGFVPLAVLKPPMLELARAVQQQ